MPLSLPISPSLALEQIIDPALALLPPPLTSAPARVQLLAHALQESGLRTREQLHGPARGLWQCERGGAVAGVLDNGATERMARALCALRGVPATSYAVYSNLDRDDLLACGVARLALYADPAPLPALADGEAAFLCYLRTWRPGAYTRGNAQQRADIAVRFAGNYALALKAAGAAVVH